MYIYDDIYDAYNSNHWAGCYKESAEKVTGATFSCKPGGGEEGKIPVDAVCDLECKEGGVDLSKYKYGKLTCVGCNSTKPDKDCPDGGPWADSEGEVVTLKDLNAMCKTCEQLPNTVVVDGREYTWQCTGEKPTPDGTTPGTTPDETTPDGKTPDGTTPDGTDGITPDGTDGTTPDGTDETTPDGTDGTTPDGTDGTTPDGTDGTTPDGTDGTTPDRTTPSVPSKRLRRSRRSLRTHLEQNGKENVHQLGDTCTVKCSGGTIAVGNSSGSNQQKESFTRQCVPAENLDDKHNRWVVNGTLTPYKEDLIELDCPSKEILN